MAADITSSCPSSGGEIQPGITITSPCNISSRTLLINGASGSTPAGKIIVSSGTQQLGVGVYNTGIVTSLTNAGIITSSTGTAGVENATSSTITTLNNTGTISGPSGVWNRSLISNLNNFGTITSSGTGTNAAIYIGSNGRVTNFDNSGTISGATNGVFVNVGGTAGTGINALTNTGEILGDTFGINNNSGVSTKFSTLNNQQGAGSTALTYTGYLPTNYNIIIASLTNYGQLSITNATGQMAFGISSLSSTNSSIVGQTLTGVLRGFGNNLSTYLSNPLNTSSNGYTYSWSQQGNTGIWDLRITACSICVSPMSNITSGSSVQISSIGVTANPVLAGGTLVLNQGGSSSTSISITSAGGTIQSPTSGSAALSGVFSGSGGLTFTGVGSTVLSGSNTYSGGTTVSGGTLVVAGTAPTGTGDVFVASAGTLMGTGVISGNSIVSGVLKPGNSPGYLAVTQNLTLNSGSTYQQDIAGTVQANSSSPLGATGYYSFLSVGGQLIINSGATLAPMLQNLFLTTESGYGSATYVPKLGDTFRIATATGGISGTFSSVTQPTGLSFGTQFIPFYNYGGSNSLDLAVIPTSYTSTLSGSSSNTQSVAAVLDKLSAAQMSGSASTKQSNLMYSTATQTASSLAGFAQSLAGEVYADTLAVIPQTSQRVQSVVLNRLSDSAMPVVAGNPNAGMPMNSGINSQIPLGVQGNHMGNHPEVNSSKSFIATPNSSVWGEIAYQNGNRTTDTNANGFNSNLYQTVFGAEMYNENNIKAGTGFSLSTTNVSMSSGSGTVRQGSLFVYGKMPVIKDYVLDGMASVGLSSTDVSRNDPTARTSLEGKGIKGNDVLLSAGISRPFDADDVTISPYIRSTWQMVNQSSFDEGTTSAASLSVNSYSGNGIRGLIGVSVGAKNKDPMVDEYTYKANIAVGADTNTLINPGLQANLASYSTTIQTANVGSGLIQAGLYGTVKFTNNGFAYAGISGEARNGQTLGSVNLGARLQF
jgi:autotransporter-associated beta strand protein